MLTIRLTVFILLGPLGPSENLTEVTGWCSHVGRGYWQQKPMAVPEGREEAVAPDESKVRHVPLIGFARKELQAMKSRASYEHSPHAGVAHPESGRPLSPRTCQAPKPASN